uniref:Uncharacterized protein n=1 Tax=Nelumbo nucifera TaxID=4432 RepID=A0A822ZVP5_NELNU|nr:TPA_asm: hypothetical protein HUJ06_016893 [Nelumbo nucifera]
MSQALYDHALSIECNTTKMIVEIESLRSQLEGARLEAQEDHRRFIDTLSSLTTQLDEMKSNKLNSLKKGKSNTSRTSNGRSNSVTRSSRARKSSST